MDNATTTRIRRFKFKRISNGLCAFTIIEALTVLALTLVVFSIFLETLFICQNLIARTEPYIQNLYRSQFLYWLFYRQITDNTGVVSVQKFLDTADKQTIANFIKKLSNLDATNRVRITPSKAHNIKNLALKRRLEPTSDILQIKTHVSGNLTESERWYYVAQTAKQPNKYALYEYSEHRSEELLNDIISMQIKKVTKNNIHYYIFNFRFTSQPHSLSFVLKESRFT